MFGCLVKITLLSLYWLSDFVFSVGHRDEFYLAPEYQEHGIVTEKVCPSELLPFVLQLTFTYKSVFLFPLIFCSVLAQVCVYGVAAILWATAKFSLSPNQKLAMPRKLKRLLLEMAKRTPIERPTIVMAKKVIMIISQSIHHCWLVIFIVFSSHY